MNRRQMMVLSSGALALRARNGAEPEARRREKRAGHTGQVLAEGLPPESIYKVPNEVKKAKYPVIDVHCHGARPPQQVDDMVKLMDAAGVEKTVIFTGAPTAERFGVSQPYAKYPNRFDLWCSFDLTGVNQPDLGRAPSRRWKSAIAGRPGGGRDQRQGPGFPRPASGARRRGPQAGGYPEVRADSSTATASPRARIRTIRAWILSG